MLQFKWGRTCADLFQLTGLRTRLRDEAPAWQERSPYRLTEPSCGQRAAHGASLFCALVLLAGMARPAFAAAEAPGRTVLLDGVAAHVNRHIITVGDVLDMMETEHRELVARHNGEELRRRLDAAYSEALGALIERFVVLDSYETGEGRIPDWAIDKRVDEIIREQFDGDRGALLDALARENLTYKDWYGRIQQQMIVASMRSSSVEQNVNVSPEEVASYYAAHRDKYVSPARAHLRLIVMPKGGTNGQSRAKAEAAWARVAGGEDFATVAKEVSTGSKVDEGGDWGWVDPAILRPELAAAANTIKVGGISDVIATDHEFYILKVEERKASVVQALPQVQASIENAIKLERAQRLYKDWVARLKRDAYVKVFDVKLF